MKYKKYTWQTGETITSEKLNNIENNLQNSQIAGTPFYVNVIYSEDENGSYYTFNKTISQLKEVIKNKQIIYFSEPRTEDHTLQSEYWPATYINIFFDERNIKWQVELNGNFTDISDNTFTCSAEIDYPISSVEAPR